MILVNLPCKGEPRFYNPAHIVSVFEVLGQFRNERNAAFVVSNQTTDDNYLMTDLSLAEAVREINKALKGTK